MYEAKYRWHCITALCSQDGGRVGMLLMHIFSVKASIRLDTMLQLQSLYIHGYSELLYTERLALFPAPSEERRECMCGFTNVPQSKGLSDDIRIFQLAGATPKHRSTKALEYISPIQ